MMSEMEEEKREMIKDFILCVLEESSIGVWVNYDVFLDDERRVIDARMNEKSGRVL